MFRPVACIALAVSTFTLIPGIGHASAPGGGYTTQIPIEVPDVRGRAPSVALVYDSQAGDGVAGVGWSLAAGSSIRRASLGGGFPTYDGSDELILDGAKLIRCDAAPRPTIACAAAAGAAGSEIHYTTREQSGIRAVHDTAADTWTVFQPDGEVWRYEETVRMLHGHANAWLLTSQEDSAGIDAAHRTPIRFVYRDAGSPTDNRLRILERIEYGPYTVKFNYDSRDVAPTFWSYGLRATALGGDTLAYSGLRLRVVEVLGHIPAVPPEADMSTRRSYELSYRMSRATDRWLLSAVRVKGEGSHTLPPYRFEYGSDDEISAPGPLVDRTLVLPAPSLPAAPRPPFGMGVYEVTLTAATVMNRQVQHLTLDLNQDKLDDHVIVAWNGDTTTFYGFLASKEGYRRMNPLPITGVTPLPRDPVRLGDADGNGIPDLTLLGTRYDGEDLRLTATQLYYFKDFMILLPRATVSLVDATIEAPLPQAEHGYATGDLDRDGIDELVWVFPVDEENAEEATYPSPLVPKAYRGLLYAAIYTGLGHGQYSAPRRVLLKKHFQDLTQFGLLPAGHTLEAKIAGGRIRVATRLPAATGAAAIGAGAWKPDGTMTSESHGLVEKATVDLPAHDASQAQWEVGDLDGDGELEDIFFGRMPLSPTPLGVYRTHIDVMSPVPQIAAEAEAANVLTPMGDWRVADLDGDGRQDLVASRWVGGNCTSWPVPNLTVVAGFHTRRKLTATGGIELEPFTGDQHLPRNLGCSEASRWLDGIASQDVADLDGDGAADINAWTAVSPDVIDPLRPADPKRIWFIPYGLHGGAGRGSLAAIRYADVNGDGLSDVVRLTATHPGVRLEVSLRTRTGDVAATVVDQELADLGNVAAAGFRVGDVNGDNRADLVLPVFEESPSLLVAPHRVRIVELVSNGDGSFAARVRATDVGSRMDSDKHWYLLDHDGDGRSELVYHSITPLTSPATPWCPAGQGSTLTVFLASPTGYLPSHNQSIYTCFGMAGSGDLKVVDVDRDGRDDLVGVWNEPSEGATGIERERWTRVLRSLPDGRFEDAYVAVDLDGVAAAPSSWQRGDVNGDGAPDLVSVGDGEAHLLLGTGAPTFVAHGWRDEAPSATLVALRWVLTDWDGDGMSDLVRLSLASDEHGLAGTRVVAFTSRPTATGEITFRGDSARLLDTRSPVIGATQLLDLNGDQQADVEWIDEDRALGATSIGQWRQVSTPDQIVKLTSPLGGITELDYDLVLEVAGTVNAPADRCLLESSGYVLGSETIRDGLTSMSDRTTYAYDCPVWLQDEHRPGGWRQVEATQLSTGGWARTVYDISSECGARAETQTDLGDGTFLSTTSTFVPRGPAPFACGVETTGRYVNTTALGAEGPGTVMTESAFEYDAFGLVKKVTTYAVPRVLGTEQVSVVGRGLVGSGYKVAVTSAVTFAEGALTSSTSVEYGTRGLPVLVKRLDDVHMTDRTTEIVSYDAWGNPEAVKDPRGHQTSYGYTADGRFLHTITDALNHVTTLEHWPAQGLLKSVESPDHLVTSFNYDGFGRLAHIEEPTGAVTTILHYDSVPGQSGKVVTVRVPAGEPAVPDVSTREYIDGLGRPVAEEVMRDFFTGAHTVASRRWTQYADASDLPIRVSEWYDPAVTGTPAYESYSYDFLGRLTANDHPNGTRATRRYFADRVISEDELGHQQVTVSDVFGRVAATLEPVTGGWAETRYLYQGLETRIRGPRNHDIVRVRDTLGRLVHEEDPNLGTRALGYDAAGNAITATDARGITHTVTYDEINRPTSRVNDDDGRLIEYRYDGIRLMRVDDSGSGCVDGAMHLGYDDFGRLRSATKCIDGNSETISRAFDALGRIVSVTYPGDEVVPYGYDALRRLKSVGRYATDIRYDAAGRVRALELGNGVVETYDLSPKEGWLTSLDIRKAGATSPLRALAFTHYADGQIQTRSSVTPAGSLVSTYGYDALHRLVSVTSATGTESFQYDELGRLGHKWDLGAYDYPLARAARVDTTCGLSGLTSTPVHAPAQIGGGAMRLSYDDAGNRIAECDALGLRRDYAWDADGQPAQVRLFDAAGGWTETNLGTDAAGGPAKTRVIKRDAAGALVALLDEHATYFPELDIDGNGPATYYFAGGRRVAVRDGAGVRWFHEDERGSVLFMTDESGDIVTGSDGDYDAYGARTGGSAGAGPNAITRDRAFAGLPQQTGTAASSGLGLVRMGARHYDPITAQFISGDPSIPELGIYGQNRYAYVMGNPVAYVDPSGYQAVPAKQDCVEGGSDRIIYKTSANPPPGVGAGGGVGGSDGVNRAGGLTAVGRYGGRNGRGAARSYANIMRSSAIGSWNGLVRVGQNGASLPGQALANVFLPLEPVVRLLGLPSPRQAIRNSVLVEGARQLLERLRIDDAGGVQIASVKVSDAAEVLTEIGVTTAIGGAAGEQEQVTRTLSRAAEFGLDGGYVVFGSETIGKSIYQLKVDGLFKVEAVARGGLNNGLLRIYRYGMARAKGLGAKTLRIVGGDIQNRDLYRMLMEKGFQDEWTRLGVNLWKDFPVK